MKMIYLAHPVAGNVPGAIIGGMAWIKWLTESSGVPIAVVAPWIVEIQIWSDANPARDAGLARCKIVVQRCDEICLVGGRVSSGMAMERSWAIDAGVRVNDLTHLGPMPHL